LAGMPGMKALVAEAYGGYRRHLDLQLAAALAFFASLALPPVAALVMAGVDRVYGQAAVGEYAFERLASTVGTDVAGLISDAVQNYTASRSGLPELLGVIGLFVASVGLVYQAQLALRHVFEYEKPRDFKRVLRLRGLGLAAMAVLVGLVVAVFGALTLINAVSPVGAFSSSATTAIMAIVALTATSLAYRWLSGRTVLWGAAIAGGVVTTAAVLIGRSLFGVYLGIADIGSAYGSFAAVFVLLMWLYALAVVFLIGAEVSRAWMVLVDSSE
jgi:membrane protein